MSTLMERIAAKRKAIAESSGRKDRPTKPAPGKSRWRILPSWLLDDPEAFFHHEFGQHYVKQMVDGKEKVIAVFTCDNATYGKRCEVCEAIQNAKFSAGDDQTVNLLANAESKGNFLFNALPLSGDDPTTPVILQLTKTTADDYFALFEEYGLVMLDPEKGIDIIIERTGAGFDTRYKLMPAAKSKPVDKGVLKRLHNLAEYVADSDENRNKALTAIGVVSGQPPMLSATPAVAGALEDHSGGVTTVIDAEIVEDDMETLEALEAATADDMEAAAPATAAPAAAPAPAETAPADSFNEPVGEEDLEAMLADLS